MTDFLHCYIQTLSVPRVTTFLALVLNAIRERSVGSIGALCAIFAAFDLDGVKVPAMGRDLLFQLKEMLLTIVPPLNQVIPASQLCRSKAMLFSFYAYFDLPGICFILEGT